MSSNKNKPSDKKLASRIIVLVMALIMILGAIILPLL